MTQTTPPPIANWPSWGQPFRKTARGLLCRRFTTGTTFTVFFSLVFMGFQLSGLEAARSPRVLVFVPPTILVLTVLHFLFIARPLYAVRREAKRAFGPWREQWTQFEQQSSEFQQSVREAGYRLEDAFSRAPAIPAVAWRLYRQLQMEMPNNSISLVGPEADERARLRIDRVLSTMLCELVKHGGPMVVGKTTQPSNVVIAILMPEPEIQVWVRLDFVRQGDALVPRFLCGIQEWASKFQDHMGRRYPGDMVRLRRAAFRSQCSVLLFAIPGFGVVIFAIAAYNAARELFTLDRVANLRATFNPTCGDSSDPAIIGLLKEQTPGAMQWVTIRPEAEASLTSIKNQMLNIAYLATASSR